MFSMLEASYSDIIQTEHNVIVFQLKNNSFNVLQYIIFLKHWKNTAKILIKNPFDISRFYVVKFLANIIELFFFSF